jgi:hypothetical protein
VISVRDIRDVGIGFEVRGRIPSRAQLKQLVLFRAMADARHALHSFPAQLPLFRK